MNERMITVEYGDVHEKIGIPPEMSIFHATALARDHFRLDKSRAYELQRADVTPLKGIEVADDLRLVELEP